PAAARLLELLLVAAEALEVLPKLRAHEARVLLEVPLLRDDVARRLEDAPLLLLVEELEFPLDRDVRGEDPAHDLRAVARRAHAVLERPDVLERLLPREVLEALARLEVAAQEIEERDDGLHLLRRHGRARGEPEERVGEARQLLRRLQRRL